MSIAGLNMATKAIQASMVAIEVTGQNISNVNDPNYTRQRANLSTDLTISRPWGQMGTGVTVKSIEQIKDTFINREIRDQSSEAKKEEVRFGAYEQLLSIYDEEAGYGIDTRIGELFDAFQDLASFPESDGMRTAVLGSADLLASQIQSVNSELDQLRLDLDSQLKSVIPEVNNLLQQVASYNTEIVQVEAGTNITAADIRDQRDAALKELSEYMNVTVTETDTGAVNVSTSGYSLVYAGNCNFLAVTPNNSSSEELVVNNVVLAGSSNVINFTGGTIAGIIEARDSDITSYRDKLDTLATSLINEVNKIHCDGMGLVGYSSVTGNVEVTDPTATLDSAGLPMSVQSGSLTVVVTKESDGSQQEFTINIDPSTDSMEAVATALDGESIRIHASVNSDGQFDITMDSGYTIQFKDDTSNFLAATQTNAFFHGTDASDIEVNQALHTTPSLIAAAKSDSPGDNTNALALAQIQDALTMTSGTQSFTSYYQSEITRLGSESKAQDVAAETSSTFLDQLQLQRESVSGVNLDEEAANLIIYQNSYNAAAKFFSAVNEMLNVLINGLI